MNRAERPDPADAGSPPPHAADDATDSVGLNGAAFDPDPELAALVAAAASAPEPDPNAAPVVVDETPTKRHRLPFRIVGAPPPADVVRDPADVALGALPIAGVNRRRMAWIVGIAVSVWIVAVFARQVGQASAAGDRAAQVRADNAALSAQVAALQHERDVVQQQSFVQFQARAYGLGTAQEKRFTLSQNAPALPSDAPGSASVHLTPASAPQTPLDTWLAMLFGPSR